MLTVLFSLTMTAGAEPIIPADTVNYVAALAKPSVAGSVSDSSRANNPSGPVFRIQILTSGSFATARLALRASRELFSDSAWVDFDSPNFKVRAGSFSSALEAQPELERVRQAGFPNPIVISQTVIQRADSTTLPVTSERGTGK